MRKWTIQYDCKGCEGKLKLSYQGPQLGKPTFMGFRCEVCESTMKLKIVRVGGSAARVLIYTLNFVPSAKLAEILDERLKTGRSNATPRMAKKNPYDRMG